MIPGTNPLRSRYAGLLRKGLLDPQKVESTYGVELDEIPSWTLEVQPGDVVVGDFRTLHASFNGGPRRRLFTLNYRGVERSERASE